MADAVALDGLVDRTPNGIALAIGRLISTGELATGDALPPVRTVAKQLNVSPTTISDAWRILKSHGAIATDGRRGTLVRGRREGAAPGRYWQVPVDPGTFAVDLSSGTPDPDLLPSLAPILSGLQFDHPVSSYLEAAVLPQLEAELRADWPFEPELMTIVDGAQDGLDRMVQALVSLGDPVVVGEQSFPPLLDMLEMAGARIVGIKLDEEGPRLDELTEALTMDPVAIFLQPRCHNPTGITMSARRSRDIADLLTDTNVTIIEDDHSGAVSGIELASIGVHLPEKVVHIRSFSKSHGPDLRLAAVGGAAPAIETMIRRRRLGPSWSSRLLQQVLLRMLTDPDTRAVVEHAEHTYGERRRRFVSALGERGVIVGGTAGLNIWVPVADEQFALVGLAANGIGAAPGTPFCVSPPNEAHLRLSIGTVSEAPEELASVIARSAMARAGVPRP